MRTQLAQRQALYSLYFWPLNHGVCMCASTKIEQHFFFFFFIEWWCSVEFHFLKVMSAKMFLVCITSQCCSNFYARWILPTKSYCDLRFASTVTWLHNSTTNTANAHYRIWQMSQLTIAWCSQTPSDSCDWWIRIQRNSVSCKNKLRFTRSVQQHLLSCTNAILFCSFLVH